MTKGPMHLLRAAWIAPMNGPLIRDGVVVVGGEHVVAVGAASYLLSTHADAAVHDYGDAVILPGLVNAHAHLELGHLSPPPNPESFTVWLQTVLQSAAGTSEAAIRAGIDECLRFGVTCVGDISKDPAVARPVLHESPMTAVSYGEVVGMVGRRHVLGPRLAAALDVTATGPRTRRGVSPHAPYSVDADGYRRCLDAARREQLPLTTHLAESQDEAAFLAEHAGPFRALWDRMDAWDPLHPPARFAGGPVRYAHSLGLLDYPLTLLAHVNYCDDDELLLLAAGRASVVYCPRTHAYFRHPPHRWREMLAAGINACVGTDSRASSPDLNLLDDLRLVYRVAPDVPLQTLWELVTVRAGRALGLGHSVGSLATGKRGDFAIFCVKSENPLREVLERATPPLAVWVGGHERPRS